MFSLSRILSLSIWSPSPKSDLCVLLQGRADAKIMHILTHFTQIHMCPAFSLTLVYVDFFSLWQQMNFNSSRICAMFTYGVQSSSVQLLKWKQKRACIPVRCPLLDAFTLHWQGSLTVHVNSWETSAWFPQDKELPSLLFPWFRTLLFQLVRGNKTLDIQGWEIQTPTHWENINRTGYWGWKLAVWSYWWWVLLVALLFLFCFSCLPFGYL